jgi:hypothetical protein
MDRKFTFISIGVVFWLSAAILMHFVAPYVFDGGFMHIAFWVTNFLVPAIVLPPIAKMTGRTKHQMLVPTALMAAPALTLDGLSVTLDTLGKTHIYANTPLLAGLTGGFLLFAFASFFIWAIYWHRP